MKKYIYTLFITLLIVAVYCSFNVYSQTIIPKLTVRILLSNGEPLANATVKVAPSIYYIDDDEHTTINLTDNNGIAVLYSVEVSSYSNKLYMIVYYGIYGEILRGSYSYDTQTYYIEIKVPYEKLYLDTKVLDEYRQPLNGTYSLIYTRLDMEVYRGFIVDGVIKISNATYDGYYLLISTSESYNDITYLLVINIDNQSFNYIITSENYMDEIIIDLHYPIINWEIYTTINTELKIMWINILVNVSDGVFSKDTELVVIAKWIKNNKTIYSEEYLAPIYSSEYIITYNITFYVILQHENMNDQIYIVVLARDSSGKQKSIETIINPWTELYTTLTTRDTGENLVSNNTDSHTITNIQNNTSVNKYTSRSFSEIGFYNPPKTSQSLDLGITIYLIGIFISLIILFYEIKSHPLIREHS